MRLIWSSKATQDVGRLFDFLFPLNEKAAYRFIDRILAAPEVLLQSPRLGARVEDFDVVDVRRMIVDDYELRYQVDGDEVRVLRIWHTREDR